MTDVRGRGVWRAYQADPSPQNLLAVERERVARYGVMRPALAEADAGLSQQRVFSAWELWRGLDRLALVYSGLAHAAASRILEAAAPEVGDQVTVTGRDMSEPYARAGESIGTGNRRVFHVGASPEFVQALRDRRDDWEVTGGDPDLPEGEQIGGEATLLNYLVDLQHLSDPQEAWAAVVQLPIFREVPMFLWPLPQPGLTHVLEAAISGYYFTMHPPLLTWGPDTHVAYAGTKRINPPQRNPPLNTKWPSLGEIVELEGQTGLVVGSSGPNNNDMADCRRYVLLEDGTLRFVGRTKLVKGRTKWRVLKVPEFARLAVSVVRGKTDGWSKGRMGPPRVRQRRRMKGRDPGVGSKGDTWKVPVEAGWLQKLVMQEVEGKVHEVDWRLGEPVPEDYYAENPRPTRNPTDDRQRRARRAASSGGADDVLLLSSELLRAGRAQEAGAALANLSPLEADRAVTALELGPHMTVERAAASPESSLRDLVVAGLGRELTNRGWLPWGPRQFQSRGAGVYFTGPPKRIPVTGLKRIKNLTVTAVYGMWSPTGVGFEGAGWQPPSFHADLEPAGNRTPRGADAERVRAAFAGDALLRWKGVLTVSGAEDLAPGFGQQSLSNAGYHYLNATPRIRQPWTSSATPEDSWRYFLSAAQVGIPPVAGPEHERPPAPGTMTMEQIQGWISRPDRLAAVQALFYGDLYLGSAHTKLVRRGHPDESAWLMLSPAEVFYDPFTLGPKDLADLTD